MVDGREWPGGASGRATEVTVGRPEQSGMLSHAFVRIACRRSARSQLYHAVMHIRPRYSKVLQVQQGPARTRSESLCVACGRQCESADSLLHRSTAQERGHYIRCRACRTGSRVCRALARSSLGPGPVPTHGKTEQLITSGAQSIRRTRPCSPLHSTDHHYRGVIRWSGGHEVETLLICISSTMRPRCSHDVCARFSAFANGENNFSDVVVRVISWETGMPREAPPRYAVLQCMNLANKV